jgi:hypothetical protein
MESKAHLFRFALWAFLAGSPVLAHAAGEGSGIADNYLVLGVVAALLVFAFTRKANKTVSDTSAEPASAPEEVEPPASDTAEAAQAESEVLENESTGEAVAEESPEAEERQETSS